MYRTVEKDEMSESLRKAFNEYERKIAAKRKENKAELHKFLEQVKIDEAKWKDRVNTLQEQLTIGED